MDYSSKMNQWCEVLKEAHNQLKYIVLSDHDDVTPQQVKDINDGITTIADMFMASPWLYGFAKHCMIVRLAEGLDTIWINRVNFSICCRNTYENFMVKLEIDQDVEGSPISIFSIFNFHLIEVLQSETEVKA